MRMGTMIFGQTKIMGQMGRMAVQAPVETSKIIHGLMTLGEYEMKSRAPFRTGDLITSIQANIGGPMYGMINVGVPYGLYAEFQISPAGRGSMAGRFFYPTLAHLNAIVRVHIYGAGLRLLGGFWRG